jgi:hypothetical protein
MKSAVGLLFSDPAAGIEVEVEGTAVDASPSPPPPPHAAPTIARTARRGSHFLVNNLLISALLLLR